MRRLHDDETRYHLAGHVYPAFAALQGVPEDFSPLAIPTGRHAIDAEEGREVTGDRPAANWWTVAMSTP